jgi:hypothetical protein
MLKVKNGVKPKNLIIMAAANNAAIDAGLVNDIVITSGIDGVHKIGSKHYTGDALDIRRSNIPPKLLDTYLTRLRGRLGGDYDVILEHDHIHVEYDPKP